MMRDSVDTILTAQDAANHLARISRVFSKADSASVAFTKTGTGTVSLKAGTTVAVGGVLLYYAVDTAVTMPALSAGVDYAIYACADGSLRASGNWSAPSGYTTANSRKIGGFHFSPGGNAAAQAGGDTTPTINAYSLWDLKWRPACPDPRGMTLVANGFWADIYLLGVDHLINGTSAYNVTIADGSSPPKIPSAFGGNGTLAYGSMTWHEAAEIMRAHGKRLPVYGEFAALAYGTTELSGAGSDPVSTILRAAYTSKWGVMLATGNLWVYGGNFGGGAATSAYTADTGGRGSTFAIEHVSWFGGSWTNTPQSGSRSSNWGNVASYSGNIVSARGVCDHLTID